MGYDAVRRPHLDGSAFAPRLGYHVHVGLREGKLARVGISTAEHDGPVTPEVAAMLARIVAHCENGRDDFRDLPLALDAVSEFDRRVLTTLVREVPPGETVTYGELARIMGLTPAAARAIGGAMARNPMPIVVPCHRVLPKGTWRGRGEGGPTSSAAGNAVGNYSGEGGWETKMKLLSIEGARGVWAQRQL